MLFLKPDIFIIQTVSYVVLCKKPFNRYHKYFLIVINESYAYFECNGLSILLKLTNNK